MKRFLGLILITVIVIGGVLSLRGAILFMPVFGNSMEPELKAGELIFIKEVLPSEVKVGDIIVYKVNPHIQDHYNYPPVIAHRVIKVNPEPRPSFRTKGDNTGEDPFTVLPQDLKGKVGKQIPYLGFPLLFFQSKQGLIFVIIALVILTLYLYSNELSRGMGRGRRRVQQAAFAPILEQNKELFERQGQTSKLTREALEKFASAMAEYAKHLQSHTAAIKDLPGASQELKNAAQRIKDIIGHEDADREEIIGEAEHVSGCYRGEHPSSSAHKPTPPGCYKESKLTPEIKAEDFIPRSEISQRGIRNHFQETGEKAVDLHEAGQAPETTEVISATLPSGKIILDKLLLMLWGFALLFFGFGDALITALILGAGTINPISSWFISFLNGGIWSFVFLKTAIIFSLFIFSFKLQKFSLIVPFSLILFGISLLIWNLSFIF